MTDQITTQDNELPSVLTLIGAYDKTGYDQGYIQPSYDANHPNPQFITDDPRPAFTGLATPNSLITIYDGDTAIGTVLAGSDGYWTFVPTTPLADGNHDISVTATNDAGTSDRLHYDFPFTIDTSNVQPEQLVIDAVFEHGGTRVGYMNILDSRVIHDSRPTIEGTAKANSVVTIKNGDQVLGTAQTDQWGHWSFTPPEALRPMTYHLTAMVDGQSSTSFDVTVEPVPAPHVSYVLDDAGIQQGYVGNGTTVDDAQPTIQGTAETYSLVTIYDNGQPIGTVLADHAGAWSFTPDKALSNGSHSFTAVVNGQSDGAPFVLNIDTHGSVPAPAPVIGAVFDDIGSEHGYVQPGTVTDDNHPQLQGTAAPGSLVTIYDNGEPLGAATADAQGNWTFTPNASLPDGQHSFTAVADGQASASFTINVDTHMPPVEEPAPVIGYVFDDAGSQSGYVQPGGSTDDDRPQLQGTAASGSVVTFYDNGEFLGTAIADGRGNWTFTPDAALGNGPHSLVATVGGQASQPFAIIVDTHIQAPVISYGYESSTGAVSNGGTADGAHLQLHGTAAPGSMVTIYDGDHAIGTAMAGSDGTWWCIPLEALPNGPHSLVAMVGGESSTPFMVNIDTHVSAPVIGYGYDSVGENGAVSNGGTTDDTHLQLHGTATPGSMVTIQDGDHAIGTATVSSDGTWWFRPSQALPDGSHSLVAVVDGQSSTPFTVNIDTHVPPVPTLGITGVETPDGIVSDNGQIDHPSYLVLFGTAPPNTAVTIWDGNTKLGGYPVGSSGTWEFRIPEGNATNDGEHHYTVRNAATGEVSDSFDLTIGHAVVEHDSSDNLSLNDVLGTGEGDLFTADHSHDNAGLSLHDVQAVNSADVHGMSVTTHDVSSLSTSLVLPHEQMHAHSM